MRHIKCYIINYVSFSNVILFTVMWGLKLRGLLTQIADFLKSGGSRPDEFAIGLHKDFHPLQGHDIGQFPGLESSKDICEAEVQLRA